jgi:hypothetical protein
MEPIRELSPGALKTLKLENLRLLQLKDFETAIQRIRPSVSHDTLSLFSTWSESYGTK